MKIQGSVALVTGANRGLGKVFAEQLLAAGARKVYAGARDPSKVRFSGVEPVKLDITNPADVEAAAKALGDVTLLFNNAGIAPNATLAEDQTLKIARAVMETNYFGTLRMCEAFAPILARNGGGALINMLSALSWIARPPFAAYCASKSAE
jgi:NAD(P)-dependent dehydrogenase (short-subunit alcohol dehydrogenase family)